jgi:hypothetical protein
VIVTIVGISFDEAQIGDIVIELMHNGIYTKAHVWVKMLHGTKGWASTTRFQR